jgi:hypothetical protein
MYKGVTATQEMLSKSEMMILLLYFVSYMQNKLIKKSFKPALEKHIFNHKTIHQAKQAANFI